MPTINATVKFDRAIEFEDTSGVSFNIRRKSDNVIRETIPNSSISHEPGLQSPADTFLYVMTSVETLQGGDQSDILEYVYSGDGNMAGLSATQNILTSCWAGEPIWASSDIPIEGNWTTGQDVGLLGIDLNNSIISNRDIAGTTFTIDTAASTTPNGGNLPGGVTLNANGTVTGIVDGVQGGLYLMVFVAANQYGSSKTTGDINLQVSLEVTNPEISGIPDSSATRGAIFQLAVSDFLTYDGDPSGAASLSYTIDPLSPPLPDGLSLGNRGTVSGVVDLGATLGGSDIIIRVTNNDAVDLFGTDTFTLTVLVETGANAPLVTGWFSGEASCAVSNIAPIWQSGGSTFIREVTDGASVTIDMHQFLASQGIPDVTAILAVDGTSLPAGLSISAGIITGVATEVAGDYTVRFQADNGLLSDFSPDFIFRYIDSTAVAVEITSIFAQDGTNVVSVNFSTAVITTAGTDASYEEDFIFEVNTANRTHTYLSGAGTSQLKFTLGGSVLTGGNTIDLTYTGI